MKKIIEKINNNILLFSIAIIIVLFSFLFLTTGFAGIVEGWNGIVPFLALLIKKILNTTINGTNVLVEFIWVLFAIPIIVLFKNKYIFQQKREKFFNTLLQTWPIWIFSIIYLINFIFKISLKEISILEVIALILYTFLIGVFEEIICRGWIQNEFIERFGNTRKKVILSITISSFIFGLMHIMNFIAGQELIPTIAQIISATIAGMAFGAIYYKTKNIWSVIFLHAFWDFAIFFGEINVSTTCITGNPIEAFSIFIGVFYLLSILLIQIPSVGTILLFLNKKEINTNLPKENRTKITKEDEKNIDKSKKIISIILLIYLLLYGFITFSSNNQENSICPTYIKKSEKNYSEHFMYYEEYKLDIPNNNPTNCFNQHCIIMNCLEESLQNYEYIFRINKDKKLEIINKSTNEKVTLDYENVKSLAIYENENSYDILITAYNYEYDIIVYHSNFITKSNVNNNYSFLNELKLSFKRVLLPSISEIGYYQENGEDIKYPLFKNKIEDRYILYPNGDIYIYNPEK